MSSTVVPVLVLFALSPKITLTSSAPSTVNVNTGFVAPAAVKSSIAFLQFTAEVPPISAVAVTSVSARSPYDSSTT